MIRDSEKGLGYLVGHEEPETKARRVAEIKRQIESSLRPLSNPIDAFTSLPIATTVNLEANTGVTPSVTPPVKTKRKTDAEMVRWAMGENPEPIKKKKPNKMELHNEGKKRKPILEQLTELKHWGRNRLIESEKEPKNNQVRKIT